MTTTSESLICFYFEGIVALCVSQDPAKRDHFAAGIIKPVASDDEVPKHVHSIDIRKLVGKEVAEDFPRIQYNIQNPARLLNVAINNQQQVPSVKLLRPSGAGGDLDRIAAVAGFDWVLDVEKDMHGEEVKLKREALRTVLRVSGVSDGLFYAPDMSDGSVFTRDENGVEKSYYGAAESVAAIVPLPVGGAMLSVVKKDGTNEQFPLPYAQGAIYYVNMINTCHQQGCRGMEEDVVCFYNALNDGGIGGVKRVQFIPPPPSRPSPQATPLTQCTVPDYGFRDDLPDPA